MKTLILFSIIVSCLFVSANAQELRMTEYDAIHRLAKLASYEDSIIPVADTGSMRPFLDERCVTLVRKISWNQLKTGDIILFERDGKLVGHRIVRRSPNKVVTEGDANRMEDTPISEKDYRSTVIAMFTFDPRFPDTVTPTVGKVEGMRRLRLLTEQMHLGVNEAQRIAKDHLKAGETCFTVQSTDDNARRSEQCVFIAKSVENTSVLSAGDLVVVKVSSAAKFFRALFSSENVARRIVRIENDMAVVHREGDPDRTAKVSIKSITHIVVGCVFFNARNDVEENPIFLE